MLSMRPSVWGACGTLTCLNPVHGSRLLASSVWMQHGCSALLYSSRIYHCMAPCGKHGCCAAAAAAAAASSPPLMLTLQSKHPAHVSLDYSGIAQHTNNSFVLQARSSGLMLKGQMLPTNTVLQGDQPGEEVPVMIFLASPRVRTLQEMQQGALYFSDIPLHDMSADYILLAEQRHAEADLKERYERLTNELKVRLAWLFRLSAFSVWHWLGWFYELRDPGALPFSAAAG